MNYNKFEVILQPYYNIKINAFEKLLSSAILIDILLNLINQVTYFS